jgi:hypothetical protein
MLRMRKRICKPYARTETITKKDGAIHHDDHHDVKGTRHTMYHNMMATNSRRLELAISPGSKRALAELKRR